MTLLDRILTLVHGKTQTTVFSCSSGIEKRYNTLATNLAVKVVNMFSDYVSNFPNDWNILAYQPASDLEDEIADTIAVVYSQDLNDYIAETLMTTVGSLITIIHLNGVSLNQKERIAFIQLLKDRVTDPLDTLD
jgi:hypothetical protein